LSRNTSLIKTLLMLTLITVPVSVTLAQGAAPSVSPSPSVQNVNDIQTVKDLQQALALAAYYKARFEASQATEQAWKQQADDWHGLFNSAEERANTLQSATGDRKAAGENQGIAIELLKSQITADAGEIQGIRADLKSCQSSKYKWALVGAGMGFGAGIFSHH
jgi:hypothetical protein